MFDKLKNNLPNWREWSTRLLPISRSAHEPESDFEIYNPYSAHPDESWQHLVEELHWDQPQLGPHLDHLARIVVLGLPGSGKSTLLNAWCGWTVSPVDLPETPSSPIEDFGLFCLVDVPLKPNQETGLNLYPDDEFYDAADPGDSLPPDALPSYFADQLEPLVLAEGADLVLYLIDATTGVQPADYSWVGRLRQLGLPIIVILNKCDLLTGNTAGLKARVESQLAATVWQISARHDDPTALDRLLLEMMKLNPKLTIALGRAFIRLRPQAVHRLTRQAAWVNGLISLQPIPLVDIPIQLGVIKGLILNIAALYDRPLDEVQRREAMTAMAGGLGVRYGAQQLAKIVPVVGWLVSGLLGWSYTWFFGQATAVYFAANGDQALKQRLVRVRSRAGQTVRSVQRVWHRRPRLKLEWPDEA